MSTRVKVVVQRMPDNVAGWPCINYDYEKETNRIMDVVTAWNPETEFDVVYYTSMQQAQDDYENDLKIYDGVLVIVMANVFFDVRLFMSAVATMLSLEKLSATDLGADILTFDMTSVPSSTS